MRKNIWLVAMCFAAGALGAMVGTDLSGCRAVSPPGRSSVGAEAVVDAQATLSRASGRENNPVILAVKKVGPATVNIDTVVMRRTSIFGFTDPFDDFFGTDPFSRLSRAKVRARG
ncbi:MAG: hypothetical protein ACP5R5_09215 [Armatimonadota bacterium]